MWGRPIRLVGLLFKWPVGIITVVDFEVMGVLIVGGQTITQWGMYTMDRAVHQLVTLY